MFFRKEKLPAFLDPTNKHGNSEVQQLVQQETGGDVSKMKLNSVIAYYEKPKEIDRVLAKMKHGIRHLKLHSKVADEREDDIPDIVSISKKHNITPYIGGGETERAIKKNSLLPFVQKMNSYEIDTVEISRTELQGTMRDFRTILRQLRSDFANVIVEIGEKRHPTLTKLSDWEADLDAALEIGAENIVIEAGGRGVCGVCDDNGNPNVLLAKHLQMKAGKDAEKIIYEAPHQIQREYWARELTGWNGKFGNVAINQKDLQEIDLLRVACMYPESKDSINIRTSLHAEVVKEILEIAEEEKLNREIIFWHLQFHGLSADHVFNVPNRKEALRKYLVDENRLRMTTMYMDLRNDPLLRRILGRRYN